MLKVSEINIIYFEESDYSKGKPILVLYDCSMWTCSPIYRQYFDKEVYRLIMFDQRGEGKSISPKNLIDNTTDLLISVMEKLKNI